MTEIELALLREVVALNVAAEMRPFRDSVALCSVALRELAAIGCADQRSDAALVALADKFDGLWK